jgi:hypothetical protein
MDGLRLRATRCRDKAGGCRENLPPARPSLLDRRWQDELRAWRESGWRQPTRRQECEVRVAAPQVASQSPDMGQFCPHSSSAYQNACYRTLPKTQLQLPILSEMCRPAIERASRRIQQQEGNAETKFPCVKEAQV